MVDGLLPLPNPNRIPRRYLISKDGFLITDFLEHEG